MDQISTQCSQVQELGCCFPRQQPSITAVSGACSTFSWRRCLAWPICLRHGCMDSYSYVVRAWSSGRLLIESPVRSARSTAKISSHSRSSVGGLCHISVAALRNGDEGHMFSEDTEFRPVSEAHANETFSARSGAESLNSIASGDEADILAEGISAAVPRGFSPSDGASQLVFPSPRKRNGASHGNPVEEAISWPDSGGEEERSASLRKLATDMFLVKTSSQFEVDYLGESTKGDMNVKRDVIEAFDNEGVSTLEGPIEEVAKIEAKEAKTLLDGLRIPARFPHGNAQRGIFCTRTLNLRSITTIGYDMDYTLIHYNVNAWEGRAYEYGMDNLRSMGYPVDGLQFDPELVIRGLIMDKENGNLVKADRFGYVKRAMHGTRMLSNRAISEMYGRELVDLRNETRWEFLNTLFSVSEAVMYMQMVDRLDEGALPPEVGPLDYCGLHKVVAKALFRAHVEGQLKDEIINQPERFVEPDPELPLALLDQREAGKRLILITNSDYHYTNKMMQYAFNQFLPNGLDWRSLFDMVIVSARKPEFFQMSHPLYEIVTEDGLMQPCFKARSGGLYCGGSAQMVENALGFQGDETLYVGDHIYTDVSQSKVHLRWRTALICRELEEEVKALACGREHRAKLIELMNQKEVVGHVFNQLRLALQRRTAGYAGQYALYVRQSCFVRPEFKSSFLPYLLLQTLSATDMDERELAESMQKLLIIMQRLDQKIAPMLEADGKYFNKRWGYLSRAGLWDKSHLTRQIEKYADIYTSRVSNFLCYTPFMYFRSQAQTLAHDLLPHWPESYSEYT